MTSGTKNNVYIFGVRKTDKPTPVISKEKIAEAKKIAESMKMPKKK